MSGLCFGLQFGFFLAGLGGFVWLYIAYLMGIGEEWLPI
jgi:hypothetical protein